MMRTSMIQLIRCGQEPEDDEVKSETIQTTLHTLQTPYDTPVTQRVPYESYASHRVIQLDPLLLQHVWHTPEPLPVA